MFSRGKKWIQNAKKPVGRVPKWGISPDKGLTTVVVHLLNPTVAAMMVGPLAQTWPIHTRLHALKKNLK